MNKEDMQAKIYEQEKRIIALSKDRRELLRKLRDVRMIVRGI